MTTEPNVRPGQVWADADPRFDRPHRRRLLRVIAVGQPGPFTARVVSWYEERRGIGGDWVKTSPERPSTIRLSRFRPTSTGYRLVLDVDEQRIAGASR